MTDKMKVGILGSGVVGKALAAGFLKYGHDVTIGTRAPDKLADWSGNHPEAKVAGVAETAENAEIIVLAVKGTAAADVLRAAGADHLAGKTIVDTTNPIADAPPQNGVLRFFTDLDESLMELLQREFPEGRFVKAFNSIGNAFMVDPRFPGGPPTMFICGDDEDAKRSVKEILDQFGWETADMGTAEAARAIEPLCILWCIPGFLHNNWQNAFKMLSMDA